MTEPELVYADDDIQLATWSRVFVNRWVCPARKDLLVRLSEVQGAHVDAMPDGRTAVFTILAQDSNGIPDSAARKEAEQVAKRYRDAVQVSAQIVLGEGFLATTARALLTGVNLATRLPYPIKVFRSIDESLPWFREQLDKQGFEDDAAGFPAAIQSLIDRGWR